MLRTLFTPRWLALLGVLVAVCVAFVWLGLWQLAVAQDSAYAELQAQRDALVEKPLDEVMAPHSAFPEDGAGHPVRVDGQYDAARQFLVPDRVLDGQDGYWVVTPLTVADGAVVPVLRGFVTDPAAVDIPPVDPVTVHGELAPGESPYFGEEALPEGQRGTIDLSMLANIWPESLYNGFIFSTSEEPSLTSTSLAHVPPPQLTAGDVDWRNLGYALQWWVFAAFAVFMFGKLLHDASRGRDAGGAPSGSPPTVSSTPAAPSTPAGAAPSAAPADERIESHHV